VTTPPLRIGLVGASRILPTHMRGYAAIRAAGFDNFRITAICSRDPERAKRFIKPGDGPPPPQTFSAPHTYINQFQTDVEPVIFTDLGEMLASGLVDAVDNTNEVALHHTQTAQAAEAGVHVLVEKPMAITMRAGKAMVDAAARHGINLTVCENARFHHIMRIASWLQERGDLGSPQFAAWWVLATAPWAPDNFTGNSPWRHVKSVAGGGATLDIIPHIIHRLRMLCGEVRDISGTTRIFEPTRYLRDASGEILESVQADVDDAFMAIANFESGAIANFSFTFSGHGGPTAGPQPIFYGSRGCIRGEELQLDGSPSEPLQAYFDRNATAADRDKWFPRGLADPFGLLIHEWINAIREGRPSLTSGEQGLLDLAASYAVIESSVAGRAVTPAEMIDGGLDTYQRELDRQFGFLP
jgi:predicted dehydrogenase